MAEKDEKVERIHSKLREHNNEAFSETQDLLNELTLPKNIKKHTTLLRFQRLIEIFLQEKALLLEDLSSQFAGCVDGLLSALSEESQREFGVEDVMFRFKLYELQLLLGEYLWKSVDQARHQHLPSTTEIDYESGARSITVLEGNGVLNTTHYHLFQSFSGFTKILDFLENDTTGLNNLNVTTLLIDTQNNINKALEKLEDIYIVYVFEGTRDLFLHQIIFNQKHFYSKTLPFFDSMFQLLLKRGYIEEAKFWKSMVKDSLPSREMEQFEIATTRISLWNDLISQFESSPSIKRNNNNITTSSLSPLVFDFTSFIQRLKGARSLAKKVFQENSALEASLFLRQFIISFIESILQGLQDGPLPTLEYIKFAILDVGSPARSPYSDFDYILMVFFFFRKKVCLFVCLFCFVLSENNKKNSILGTTF